MSKYNFPFVALMLGIVFIMVLLVGGQPDSQQVTKIPLLTLLIVSEFAFFVCVIGVYLSVRRVTDLGYSALHVVAGGACLIMAVWFMKLGIGFWPL